MCSEEATVVAGGHAGAVLGQIPLWLSQYVKAGIFQLLLSFKYKTRSSVVLLERRRLFVCVFNEDPLFSGGFALLEAVN